MNQEILDKLIDKWEQDKQFRAELKKNPEATLKKAGVELSADELAFVRKIDWSASDDEIYTRVTTNRFLV